MGLQVQRDDARKRYYALVDGQEAHILFVAVDPHTLDFQHTAVPPGLRGRGIGGELIRAALADVRARGERIVPTCPFVKAYLAQHPEDQALAVDGHPEEKGSSR